MAKAFESCSCQPQTCSNLHEELAQLQGWGGGRVALSPLLCLIIRTYKDMACHMGGNKSPHSVMFVGF